MEVADELFESLTNGQYNPDLLFPHLPITEHAFPEHTEIDLAKVRVFLGGVTNHSLHTVLTLACVSVLEEISYTRKDGQFLPWDPQSGRDVKPKLHKSCLRTLGEASNRRMQDIADDLPALKVNYSGTAPEFIEGSSLNELQRLPDKKFDEVVTSPPYANRYDYTGTYALRIGVHGIRFGTIEGTAPNTVVVNRRKQVQTWDVKASLWSIDHG